MKSILEPDDKLAQLDLIVRSNAWQTLLDEVVIPRAASARGTLLTSKSIEEVRAAQATLATLKAVVEAPYLRSKNKVPRELSSLWDA